MNETTKKRYNHLTNPWVLISLLVAIFGIWVTRGSLNARINRLEEFKSEVNIVEIQKDLSEIKANVSRIMNDLQSKNR